MFIVVTILKYGKETGSSTKAHWKQKNQFINLVLSPNSVLVYKDIKFVMVPLGKIF